jgi:outer membrane protein OmpA-like peptidoglycan-associated protein
MKVLAAIFILALTFSLSIAQSNDFVVNLEITNQISGSFVDADLSWPDADALKRISKGKYQIVLPPGTNETLIISREGYFDSKVPLEFEKEKKLIRHEVKLQPGIPQLYLTVLNDETDETLTTAVDLFTMNDSSIVFSEEVEVSPYTIDLEYNEAHILQVRKPGFFSYKDTIDFTGVFEGRGREKKIRLVPLKAGNKISLNNIYFKQNEANLTSFAQLMLVELTHVLEQQQNIVIEIGAFTDDVGSNDYNLALSQKRANAVKNYLLKKGASANQLQAKGYGEISPVAPNDNDANRALNRRVEFKIVSIN